MIINILTLIINVSFVIVIKNKTIYFMILEKKIFEICNLAHFNNNFYNIGKVILNNNLQNNQSKYSLFSLLIIL